MVGRYDEPAPLLRRESCRHAGIIAARSRRRLDQQAFGTAVAQRPAHLLLEFMQRLQGIPPRRPEARDERGRRMTEIAFHGEGERGIGIIRRLHFMYAAMRRDGGASGGTMRLPRIFSPAMRNVAAGARSRIGAKVG